jgi:hypothetical protein
LQSQRLKQQFKQSQTDSQILQQQKIQLGDQLGKKDQELGKLRQEIDKNDNILKELKKQLTTAQEQNQSLQGQIQHKQQAINEQKNQISQFQKQAQNLNELSNIIDPGSSAYDFSILQQEVKRLKIQELAPQARGKRVELEQSIANAKTKASGLEKMVDLLMETQKQIMQTNETSQKDKLNGKIEAYQNILEDNLTSEELQVLLNKQTELYQLEKHLASLQINQEQIAQIQQSYSPKQ